MRFIRGSLLLLAPSAVLAQTDAAAGVMYPAQQRVRVEAPALFARPIVGRVAGLDSQSLSLTVTRKGSTLSVPLSDVTALRASGGIDRRTGVRRGMLVGLALGTWLFADTYGEVQKDDYWGIATLAIGFVSFVVTPALGGLAGAALAPERWEPLATPAPTASTPVHARILLSADEDVRVTGAGGRHRGRVQSQTGDLLTIATGGGSVAMRWQDMTKLSVRGERSRRRGAVRGAIIAAGITVIGVATDPLPTAGENLGVMLGNAAFGAAIGAFFPARGWTDVPVPRGAAP